MRSGTQIHHTFFSFHIEWMNYISNTSLMTQFIAKLSSQLSRPLNWTYNIQAWDLVPHSVAAFFRLLGSPHYFSLCLDCSYTLLRCHLPGWWGTERGSRGFCQCCCQKDKNVNWTQASIWWKPNLWAVHPSGLSFHWMTLLVSKLTHKYTLRVNVLLCSKGVVIFALHSLSWQSVQQTHYYTTCLASRAAKRGWD